MNEIKIQTITFEATLCQR